MSANGYGISFWDDKNVLKFIVMMVSKPVTIPNQTKNPTDLHTLNSLGGMWAGGRQLDLPSPPTKLVTGPP